VQQKAVRTEQLDQIEAQPLRAHCRRRMSVANARQPGLAKRFWDRPTIVDRDAG
jgi:hypothetical protein